MTRLFTTKRIVVAGITTAVVLGSASAAFAYFTASGSGTGSATTGTTGTWSVTQASTTGTMYPGSGSSVITFNVKNTGTGDQQYSTATAAINSSSSDITQSGTALSGCLASWYTASVTSDPDLSTKVAGGATVQVQVTVTMPSDSVNQDACESATPDVSLSIS